MRTADQNCRVREAAHTEAEASARGGESVEQHLIMPDNVKLARDVTVPQPCAREAQAML